MFDCETKHISENRQRLGFPRRSGTDQNDPPLLTGKEVEVGLGILNSNNENLEDHTDYVNCNKRPLASRPLLPDQTGGPEQARDKGNTLRAL